MGAVPTRIDGLGRAAFALLFCGRASFCTVGGRIYDKRTKKRSGASETAGNRQRVARNEARRCVFRRVCLHGASHAAPELARWTQKHRCFFANHGRFRGKAAVFLECAVERGAKQAPGGGTSGREGRESGSVRPQHVVLPIGDHVKEQRDGYGSTPPGEVTSAAVRETAQHDVEGDGGIGMERMKADAHAVGREDGRGQEVVEIDNHGG